MIDDYELNIITLSRFFIYMQQRQNREFVVFSCYVALPYRYAGSA